MKFKKSQIKIWKQAKARRNWFKKSRLGGSTLDHNQIIQLDKEPDILKKKNKIRNLSKNICSIHSQY